MSAKQELFEQIAENFAILDAENGGTTKASQARARKAAGEIKKLITPYKKANMDAVKGQGVFLLDEVATRIFKESPAGNGGVFYFISIYFYEIEQYEE